MEILDNVEQKLNKLDKVVFFYYFFFNFLQYPVFSLKIYSFQTSHRLHLQKHLKEIYVRAKEKERDLIFYF